MQSKVLGLAAAPGTRRRCRRRRPRHRASRAACCSASSCTGSSSTTSTRRIAASACFEFLEGFRRVARAYRLEHVADRAQRQCRLRASRCRNHMHRDVAGARVVLQAVEHGQAGMVRQPDIQHDRAGQVLARQASASSAVVAIRHWKSSSWARSYRIAAKVASSSTTRMIRPSPVSFSRSSAIVGADFGRGWAALGRRVGETRAAAVARRPCRCRRGAAVRRLVGLGQGEGEGAALARLAGQLDLAAEQPRQLARNREAQARCRHTCGWSCRPPGGRARRWPAAARRECRCRCRARRKRHGPCAVAADLPASTCPCSVNFSALDSRFLQHLLQPLRVGFDDWRARPAAIVDVEARGRFCRPPARTVLRSSSSRPLRAAPAPAGSPCARPRSSTGRGCR